MLRLAYVNCGDTHPLQCSVPPDLAINEKDACVIEVEKNIEFGYITNLLEQDANAEDALKKMPIVLRRATLQDQSRASENTLFAKTALRLCQNKIDQYHLPMRLLRVRYSFDRARLLLTFTATDRVDYRQLIQDLAAETRARVEMRQIGVRDAAGIIGGLAPCGRPLCCSVWVEDFDNIHIRMAKAQGLSLNPANLNGMCDRLKCCLRFENNCYRDLGRHLPRKGDRVKSPAGQGQVLETHILAQRIKISLDDQRILEFDAQDVIKLGNARINGNNTPE